ncbi:hypothetical protein HKX48_008391 [Thoreauomyces humboldtii]|nr:hypothetical protein HKX48_008391 [Thoreauomyces humboldtii]
MLTLGSSAHANVARCLRVFHPRLPIRVAFANISTTSALGSTSTTQALVYTQYGRPEEVLCATSLPLPLLPSTHVRVRFLAAPVNPADINQLQGTYPIKPPFGEHGAVGGSEGVAVVESVGAEAGNTLAPGDWVLPLRSGSGTWRIHADHLTEDLMKIPNDLASVVSAATITVNPATAYRMIKDFADLKPGDVILQNGANSGVGQSVIQLAKAWNLRTVNIVRDRPDVDGLKSQLTDLGADLVVTEEEARLPATAALVAQLGPPPTLALNCVGGKSATALAKLLSSRTQAHLVTYGGMSRQPLTLPTSAFIFRDLVAHGFWMTRWYESRPVDERRRMVEELLGLAGKGKLREPWHETHRFGGTVEEMDGVVKEVLAKAGVGFGGKKQIFLMDA